MKRLRRSLAASLLLALITPAAATGSFAVEEPAVGEPTIVELPNSAGAFHAPIPGVQSPSRPAPDALDRALRDGDVSPGQYALQRARTLFTPSAVSDRYGVVRSPGRREGTPILLDLASRLDELGHADREEALELFARPTDGNADPDGNGYDLDRTGVRYVCRPEADSEGKILKVCVHWADKTSDAPPKADADGDDVPDQVEMTQQVLDEVWNLEVVTYGYRMPLRDRGRRNGQGPNRGLDVYLVDVGQTGLFGYCTSDESPSRRIVRAHAYCVLDNDYASNEYEDLSSQEALQVAVAHEFFHAIQFAYEYSNKDRWLKEGTAVWMEDEVYDEVNDLYAFLDESALHQPEIPLDRFQSPSDGQDFEYGAWIFWRFLSEYFGTPDIIRDVWDATAPTDEGDPSALKAVRVAAAAREPLNGLLPTGPTDPYRRAVAEFGLWNRVYDLLYEEGTAYAQVLSILPPDEAVFLLDDQRRGTGARHLPIDHLASGDVLVFLGTTSATELVIDVDLPNYPRGPEANVVFFRLDGSGFVASIALDAAGDGEIRFIDLPNLAVVVLILHNTDGELDDETYAYEATLVS